MDFNNFQWVAQFGVSAVLAFIMFHFYRQDRKASEEKFHTLAADFRSIVQENTKAVSGLKQYLENGKSHVWGDKS